MDLILINDNETTGFPRSGMNVQDQARICQIALILCDGTGKTISKYSTLIKPDGWKISEGAFKVHGITDEQCEKYGLPIETAINVLNQFASKAQTFVAHGADFDKKMIDIEYAFYNALRPASQIPAPTKPWYCTMASNRHINEGKNPNLSKALRYFCARELPEGEAHDALFDAQACKEIYFASTRGIRQ